MHAPTGEPVAKGCAAGIAGPGRVVLVLSGSGAVGADRKVAQVFGPALLVGADLTEDVAVEFADRLRTKRGWRTE